MPKGKLKVHAANGLVTARDASTLREGELSVATGGEYREGSPHYYKLPGRSSTSSALGAAVQAINKCQYDTGTDKLVAVAGGSIYESAVSTSPSWGSTQVTGLSTTEGNAPHFSCHQDRWLMCNGSDSNYIREPDTVPTSGWTTGAWRTAGMKYSELQTEAAATATTGSNQRADTAATTPTGYSAFTNPTNVTGDDNTDTYAAAYATTAGTPFGVQFAWTTDIAHSNGRYLKITHAGTSMPIDADFPGVLEVNRGLVTVKYSTDAGTTWTTVSQKVGAYDKTVTSVSLGSGVDVANNLLVQVLVQRVTGDGGGCRVYDVRVHDGVGSATTYDTTNDIYYLVTERYEDSDEIVHESRGYATSDAITVDGTGSSHTSVAITLPAAALNTFATEFVIYRSIDETEGGYPNLWEVGTAPVSEAGNTWYDDFALYPLATTTDKDHLYDYLEILYPSNEKVYIPLNDPPPKAKVSFPFQGSMCYLSVDMPRRLYYSVPSTMSPLGIEQVPALYYLDFITPKNDDAQTGLVTNGGRTTLIFFEGYTMMVNRLPLATDPGVFDTRIKEYVSNTRGSSGRLTACEFTLPNGQTLAASIDSQGLWVTNGVNLLQSWSSDLDWTTAMSGVTLSNGELTDNSLKKRLEWQYENSDGDRYEYHFFYGRLKRDGEGDMAPIISGPHPTGTRCSHYCKISGADKGFKGDDSATGDVFLENSGNSDASNGYNASGHIPFIATSGEHYDAELEGAVTYEFGYPKFTTDTSKTFNIIGTFTCDDNADNAVTKTVTFNSGSQKKVFWHNYANRHKVSFQDISATAAPAFVGYEVTYRRAGSGRDK